MAEMLLIGLAKTVVEGAMSKAKAAIEEEAMMQRSAKSNILYITLEFEMIHSFLDVANQQRAMNNLVKTWVKQVRQLAYDLDDCIELVVHLDFDSSRWCFRLAPPGVSSHSMALDAAVAELEELRARAEELSKCYLRYRHITDSEPKLVMLQQQQQQQQVSAASAIAIDMLLKAREGSRRQPYQGDLAQLITKKDGQQLRVISVWETVGGDLGTTPIIRQAYNDPSILAHFPRRAWVKLVHPFNPHDFVRSIMAQFYTNSCKQRQKSTTVGVHVLTMLQATKEDDLFKEFEQLVTQERYLLVLEGLENMLQWEAVGTFLPDMENGSWIVVPTQRFEIASLCIGHPRYQLTELKQFSADHSVCALFKEGPQGDKPRMVCEVSQSLITYEKIPSHKVEAANDWVKNSHLVGRESEMDELRRYTEACVYPSHVICVWGMVGVGKSALVRNLYYDRMIHSERFNKYSWVDLSHPFNLSDFCRTMLFDCQTEKDPIEECFQLINNYRCLIVIDDIKSTEEWDMIHTALVSRSCKSVIIVITAEANIARYCGSTPKDESVFHVNGLEADMAFQLFQDEVERKNPSSFLKDRIEEDGSTLIKQLIWKAGGLPRVIVAIAGVLARQTATWMDTVLPLTRRFMHHLETKPEYDLKGLFGWLHPYFSTCPDSLKPCIFYLLMFQRDQIIRRRRLLSRWIAEGYTRVSDERSAEDNGEKNFSDLLDMSIIQQPPQKLARAKQGNTKIGLCQVNGFMYEYIMSRQMEETFVLELGNNSCPTNHCAYRHLVISSSWDRDIGVFMSMDFSRLRSLTVFGKWESFLVDWRMKILRVLDLEDTSGVRDEDLENICRLCRRLQFLSLRGCYDICNLTSSLGDMRQLQTLDVRHTSVVALPKNITKLQKLQYLRAGTTIVSASVAASCNCIPRFRKGRHLVGVKVPKGIGRLTALHTLGVVSISASRGDIVRELRKLTQLRKLGVSGVNGKNGPALFIAISGYIHLECLSVWLEKGNQGFSDYIFLPWENLRSLKLYGLNGEFPVPRSIDWGPNVESTIKLQKLDLDIDNLAERDMKFLGEVPRLSILQLRVKQLQDGKLNFYAESNGIEEITYEKVKTLEIACTSSNLNVTFGSKSMKNLELLEIDYSSGSSYQFSGLEHLSQLKEVLLKGDDDEKLKADIESQLANHPKTPVAKLLN